MRKSQDLIFEMQLTTLFYVLLWLGIILSFIPIYEKYSFESSQAVASSECLRLASLFNSNAVYGKEFSTTELPKDIDFDILDENNHSIQQYFTTGNRLQVSVDLPTGTQTSTCKLLYYYKYGFLRETPAYIPQTYWRYVQSDSEYLEW
jgi:hypothetical protein